MNTQASATFSNSSDIFSVDWIRLEQEQEEVTATVEEVAQLVDASFGVTSCGETELDPEEIPEEKEDPTEEEFNEAVKTIFPMLSCDKYIDGTWEAKVKVWKNEPDVEHILKCVDGEVTSSNDVDVDISENLEVDSSTYVVLDKPVIAEKSFAWSGAVVSTTGLRPTIKRTGNVLHWDGEASGIITAKYESRYSLDTILVDFQEEVEGEEVEGSVVWGFYNEVADTIELEEPDDSDLDTTLYCSGEVNVPKTEKELWTTTIRQWRCQCSGEVEYTITSPPPTEAELLKYIYPGITKTIEEGYVDCNERDANISDYDFYKEKCCGSPPGPLPECKKTYRQKQGGATLTPEEIKEYRNRFYPKAINVIYVAPEDGDCGDIITEWRITARDCCDEVSDLLWDEEYNGEVIADNSSMVVRVSGGTLPITWSVAGDGFYLDSARTLKKVIRESRNAVIYTDEACGSCKIIVSDGCSRVDEHIRSTNGQWEPIPYSDGPLGLKAQYFVSGTQSVIETWNTGAIQGKYRVHQKYYLTHSRVSETGPGGYGCSYACGKLTTSYRDLVPDAIGKRYNLEGYPEGIAIDSVVDVAPEEFKEAEAKFLLVLGSPIGFSLITSEGCFGVSFQCGNTWPTYKCTSGAVTATPGRQSVYGTELPARPPETWEWVC